MFRILVVDDERDARQTLQGILEDAGHTVHSVANEGEALNAAVKERFDLAFIDMRLHNAGDEDESGLSLATAILTLNPRVQIVLMTKYQPRISQVVRAVRYFGAINFIKKSPDLHTSVPAVLAEAEQAAGDAISTSRDATKFSVSILARNQPIRVRAQGRYVCSTCSEANFALDVEDYLDRSASPWLHPDFRSRVARIGKDLWQDLFVDYPEVKDSFQDARAADPSLVLHVETSPDLLGLPIEFIHLKDRAEYLVLQHPLMRFVCGVTPKRQVISEMLKGPDPVRVLIVAANTSPAIPEVDHEARQLHKFFQDEGQKQDHIPIVPKLIPSEEATYERVRRILREEEYDILHYAGHAAYDRKSPERSSLYFRNGATIESGSTAMRGTELKLLLEESKARLVYLSCCEGATWGQARDLINDDFLGLADCVIRAGVPSVLGFRWPVPDTSSHTLALAFYKSLLKHYRPEVALWHARRELAGPDKDDPTWLSPILIQQE